MRLKMMTLNLHCYAEEDIEKNQLLIAEMILKKDLDIVFFQEVAQLETDQNKQEKMISVDNYGLIIKNQLASLGKNYHYYYDPIKASFSIYQEGVAILSKKPLKDVQSKYISKSQNYQDWKSRKLLFGIYEADGVFACLSTTHFGWSDGFEVFEQQFDLATKEVESYATILAGDFNITPSSKEYEYIMNKGWFDILKQDATLFETPTFRGDTVSQEHSSRLDYFMINRPCKLHDAEILFVNERVSDHYGVYVDIELN